MDRIFQKKSSRRTLHAFAGFVALSLAASAAQATTELAGAALEAESSLGAENCPGSEALKTRTLALGLPPAEPREPLEIHVLFRREGDAFHATLRTTGRIAGERELTAPGPSCDALAAATAVSLAVLLDLRPRERTTPPPAPAPAFLPAAPDTPGLFRYAALHAHYDMAYGLLGPSFSVAFGADARVRLGVLDVLLGGFATPDHDVEFPPGSVDVGLAAGQLGVCVAALHAPRLELGGCAAFLMGSFRASGHGYYADGSRAALWLAGSIGATLAFELSQHWAARLSTGAVIPFLQQEPVVSRVGSAYDAPAVASVTTLGPELRFP